MTNPIIPQERFAKIGPSPGPAPAGSKVKASGMKGPRKRAGIGGSRKVPKGVSGHRDVVTEHTDGM